MLWSLHGWILRRVNWPDCQHVHQPLLRWCVFLFVSLLHNLPHLVRLLLYGFRLCAIAKISIFFFVSQVTTVRPAQLQQHRINAETAITVQVSFSRSFSNVANAIVVFRRKCGSLAVQRFVCCCFVVFSRSFCAIAGRYGSSPTLSVATCTGLSVNITHTDFLL